MPLHSPKNPSFLFIPRVHCVRMDSGNVYNGAVCISFSPRDTVSLQEGRDPLWKCLICHASLVEKASKKKKTTQDSQRSSKQARLNFAFRNGKSQEGNTHNGGGYLSSVWYLSTGAQALQFRAQASTAGQQPTPAEWPCLSCYGVASIASVKIQTERRSSEPSRL